MRKKKRRHPLAQLLFSFMKREKELPRFWQPRFYDFNVYSRKKKREKLEYMHANPVKRGLVQNPASWTWSSYLFYVKGEAGLVPIDPVD
jgi:REP-associated tyrosine transposase